MNEYSYITFKRLNILISMQCSNIDGLIMHQQARFNRQYRPSATDSSHYSVQCYYRFCSFFFQTMFKHANITTYLKHLSNIPKHMRIVYKRMYRTFNITQMFKCHARIHSIQMYVHRIQYPHSVQMSPTRVHTYVVFKLPFKRSFFKVL